MYNRSKFNSTPFNRSASTRTELTGRARGVSMATGTLRIVRELSALAQAVASTKSSVVRLQFLAGENANAISGSNGVVTRIRFLGGESNALSDSYGGQVVSAAILVFTMPDLMLSAGDVLQIDTEEMTVTINGNNAIYLVADDSEFFKLQPGNGTITVDFDSGETADIRILWKERYL